MWEGWIRKRLASPIDAAIAAGLLAAFIDWFVPSAGEFRILLGLSLVYLVFLVHGHRFALVSALCLSASWILTGNPPVLAAIPLAAVGGVWLLRRWGWGLPPAAGAFWLLLGLPALWGIFAGLLDLPPRVAAYVALNYALNGIACAALAALAERLLPSHGRTTTQLTVQETVRAFLLPLTIIPVVVLVALDAAQSHSRYIAEAERTTQLMAARTGNVVRGWWDGMRTTLRHAGQISLEEYLGYRGLPRPGLALLNAHADALAQWQLSEVLLVMASGRVVDRWPPANGGTDIDQRGWPRGPFTAPVILATPSSSGGATRITTLVPIANAGEYLGLVAGTVWSTAIGDLLRSTPLEHGTALEVRTRNGETLEAVGTPGLQQTSGSALAGNGSFARPWSSRVFVADVTIDSTLPWTLRLAQIPVALQAQALDQGLRALLAGAAICVLGGIAASMLGWGLTRSLTGVADSVSRSMAEIGAPPPPTRITELDRMSHQFLEAGAALRAQTHDARTRQERAERLVRQAPIVLFTLRLAADLQWSLASHNQTLEQQFGHPPGSITTRQAWEAIIDPTTALSAAELQVLVATGGLLAERRVRCGDGSWRWVYEQLALVKEAAGHSREVIGVWLDIHERREAELRLLQSSKLVTLGEMATGMAHELNQPLNAISLAAENLQHRLQRTDLPEDARDYLHARAERIAAQAVRAARIIDHMRVFGRGPSGDGEAFDIRDAVAGALVICGHRMRADGIVVRQTFDDGPLEAFGYRPSLEQVFVNVLLNARDALLARHPSSIDIDQPPPSRWVEITARRQDDSGLEIAIADNGGGIDAQALSRVFEPFFTTKTPGQGMGLGLSIAFGIVRDMGGSIAARNSDAGAIFTILLPGRND
ncbi:ATP-binding protein [Reyranella sp. CPCC 100927]|uniref:sensor histidine kinase n=1 Tax=Reyranella sp. CPCC 100927 TaxID=2599616 RepID=UPI0011B72906|nr:ATP-binding protein [Reyranella sp. CPCC 100927]TWT02621.1 PAS domain S-box protein [Reyranella sp. CPCC 100927]